MSEWLIRGMGAIQNIIVIVFLVGGVYVTSKYGKENKGIVILWLSAFVLILSLIECSIAFKTKKITMGGIIYDKNKTPIHYHIVVGFYIFMCVAAIAGLFIYGWG